MEEQSRIPGSPAVPEAEAPSRTLALIAVAVGALITAVSAYLYFIMPSLILKGGMPSAQADFLRLSPIFFPRLTFILLGFLGLSYMTISIRKLPMSTGGGAVREEGTSSRVIFMYALAVSYPFILPWFGFFLTSALLMGVMTYFMGTRSWWQVPGFAVVVPITIRFVFERLLSISMPRSHFEWIDAAEEAVMQTLSGIFF